MLKCFTAEQHDQETIDEVLEDQDKREEGDTLEEADQEADLLEQIPLPVAPSARPARVAIRRTHRNLRHLPKEALVQMLRAARSLKHTRYHHLVPTCSITK